MKVAAISATALALVGAAALATPSFAHDYPGYGYGRPCAEQKRDASVNGAVLGGLAGALLGSSVAGHDARGGGAAIGAVAGALMGSTIARSNAKSSDACQARDYGYVGYRQAAPYRTYAPYRGGYERSSYRPRPYAGYDPYSY